ncbi:hypothetical protein K438DRAFT_1758802 [Mycena galopus ATCC 62051]|nr:hypothetical protein K438DRAFT_1758802 [Mycena galopus ATCC 62051]
MGGLRKITKKGQGPTVGRVVHSEAKITLYAAEIMTARAHLEVRVLLIFSGGRSLPFTHIAVPSSKFIWVENQEAVNMIVQVDLKFWPRQTLDAVAMLVYFEIRLEFKSGFIIEAEVLVLTCASYYPITSLSFTAGSVALLPSQTLQSASRPFTHHKICPHAAPSPFSQILSSSFTALTCTCVPPDSRGCAPASIPRITKIRFLILSFQGDRLERLNIWNVWILVLQYGPHFVASFAQNKL